VKRLPWSSTCAITFNPEKGIDDPQEFNTVISNGLQNCYGFGKCSLLRISYSSSVSLNWQFLLLTLPTLYSILLKPPMSSSETNVFFCFSELVNL